MNQKCTILITGAGPVGLLAANLLGKAGIDTILIDKKEVRPIKSRAIGVTPPSLEILKKAGLDEKMIEAGVPVRNSEAHGKNFRLGRISFKNLKTEYPFVLAIPQNMTEAVLEEGLSRYPSVRFYRGWEAMDVITGESAQVQGKISGNQNFEIQAQMVLACDGGKSILRQKLKIPFHGAPYRDTFLMGDFSDNSGWGPEARLYFTQNGSVESFPLPGNRRRYILPTRTLIPEYSSRFLEENIPGRCGVDITRADKFWESSFGVQRYQADKFYKNRVFLCGDSAHLMSPIGGQNMNTGFADAELACFLIENQGSRQDMNLEKAGRFYTRIRKKAAKAAGIRAWGMMRAGTSGGMVWSPVRNLFTWIFLHSPVKNFLIPYFAMQNIPNRNLKALRRKKMI